MDYTQIKIFRNICDKFKLPYGKKSRFMQHRNLNEFRYFLIERINPNHRILLYGKLKKSYDKNNNPNRIIKVGEILLTYSLLFFKPNSLILNLELNFLTSMILFYILYNWCIKNNFGELIKNAYRDRGSTELWKNYISS